MGSSTGRPRSARRFRRGRRSPTRPGGGDDGVDRVIDPDEDTDTEYAIDHPSAGDIVLLARRDAWFQYYWWTDRDEAPPYATDMDIHAKPGFAPCELFTGREGLASLDPTKVGGSHGRVDSETRGVYALGGPAASGASPSLSLDGADGDGDGGEVDARAVAPTVADLLGVADAVDLSFERPSLLGDR